MGYDSQMEGQKFEIKLEYFPTHQKNREELSWRKLRPGSKGILDLTY